MQQRAEHSDAPQPDTAHADTLAVHATARLPESTPAAVPLYQTSMFTFTDLDAFADAWSRPDGPKTYSRLRNPTTQALEEALAALEGGAAAMATASGMGAISTVVLSLLRTGDHVIVQRGLYGGTLALLRDLAERWGLGLSVVDVDDPGALAAARTPATRMLYLETITNPMGQVSDLPALARWARREGLLCVVDNTFASPVLCQPLRHGADVVIHSTTKYIGGHSDVVGGVVVVADPGLYRLLWDRGTEIGASADPFAAWLTLRGLATLPLRIRRQSATARVLAHRLARHDRVLAVHWPGLPSHRSHDRAAALLSGFGGVFAFDLAGGLDAARSFTKRIALAALAPSLGGVTTTVLSPRSTSHSRLSAAELAGAGLTDGTLRVSVGLEDPDDLWADFAQALL
jgi:cystathionine beta-lyase/cystathionine gamma-synthase